MKKSITIRTTFALLIFQAILLPNFLFGQQAAASDINERIRKEGMENSQILKTLHQFTDVYGPRLTGSPNLKAAGEWAAGQMKEWGFQNTALEPWDWGHPGWVSERASGFITSPVQDSLVFEVLAWTPATKGVASGQAFQMLLPERPTQAELTAYFESVKDQVRGKMVLIGTPNAIPVNFEPPSKRIDDALLTRRFDPNATPTPAPQFPGSTADA